MKVILLTVLLSITLWSQEKDSLRQVEIVKQFNEVKQAYASTDSLQIKRLGVMEYLSQEYKAIEEKKKK